MSTEERALPVIAVTMAIRPKSSGVSNRANTTVEPNCRANFAPWATTVMVAPRTDRPFRSVFRCSVSKSDGPGSLTVISSASVPM